MKKLITWHKNLVIEGGYTQRGLACFHEIMIDAMNQLEAAIKPELKKLKNKIK